MRKADASNKIIVKCTYCQKSMIRYRKNIARNIRGVFCSRYCFGKYNTSFSSATFECLECKRTIKCSKYHLTSRQRKFCSKRCHYNNHIKNNRVKVNCYQCKNEFEVTHAKSKFYKRFFCDSKCFAVWRNSRFSIYACEFCKKTYRRPIVEREANLHTFCSRSCAAKWGQANKHCGYNRSKIEQWIEEQLNVLYPMLEIKYNNREVFKYELDIYIPSLKLAFELNGPLHYIDIYGKARLEHYQRKDKEKSRMCADNNITLISINISKIKHFEQNSHLKGKEVLKIITNNINMKLAEQSSANLANHDADTTDCVSVVSTGTEGLTSTGGGTNPFIP